MQIYSIDASSASGAFSLATVWSHARGRDIIPQDRLFVPLVTAGLCAVGLWRARSGFTARQHLLFWGAALFWVFPLSMNNVALERSGVLLFPALVLLEDAPPKLVAVVCLALAALAWWVAQLFFTGALV